jgi:hypothetical protein
MAFMMIGFERGTSGPRIVKFSSSSSAVWREWALQASEDKLYTAPALAFLFRFESMAILVILGK